MMNELYRIDIPLYNSGVYFFCGDMHDCISAMTEAGCSSQLISFYIDCADGSHGCSVSKKDENFHMIWIENFPTKVSHNACLVHEISHCTFDFLDYIGMKHEKASDEAYAYLQGFLYYQIEMFLINNKDNFIGDKNE